VISLLGRMLRTNWEGTAIQPCSRAWKAGQEFRQASAVLSPVPLAWATPSQPRRPLEKKALREAVPHRSFHP